MLPTGRYREEYVSEALEYGWRCRKNGCLHWNRDTDKEFPLQCGACGANRPLMGTVVRGVKGKR